MTTYLLKTILCSGIFYGFYFLLLEKEKMHRFNRFYLLLGLILPFVIPLITIEKQAEILPIIQDNFLIYKPLGQNTAPWSPTTGQSEKINLLPIILWSSYGFITLILLFRFGKNLRIIWQRVRRNTPIDFESSTLILLEQNLIPHSFLRCIFLNKTEYENGNIEEEILQHELAHVRQKHSFDVILMEIIHCLFWFNPILIFYRKAIQLNHEFLADEAVIKHFENPVSYQYLLLNKASQANSLSLTSQFNYLITKKRLIMMTKNTSPQRAFLIKLLFAPLFVGTVLMLSTRVDAQEKVVPKVPSKLSTENKNIPRKEMKSTIEGISPELMNEYDSILKKYRMDDQNEILYFVDHISVIDKKRLETIYEMMNKSQQKSVKVGFRPNVFPLPINKPSQSQINDFKNANKYGLWLNEKKVKNSILDNYKSEDFSGVYISKLEGGAKKGRNYDFQVNLMTNDFYEKYRKKAIEDNLVSTYFIFQNYRNKAK